MIYIVPIFIMLVAIYCMQPESANNKTIILFGNEILIWQMYFYTVIYSMLSITFFELSRKCVIKPLRFIYLCGFILMALYTVFNILLYLNISEVSEILGVINSRLWGCIFYASIVLLLVSIIIHLIRYGRNR